MICFISEKTNCCVFEVVHNCIPRNHCQNSGICFHSTSRKLTVIWEDSNIFGSDTQLQRCSDMKRSLANLGSDADCEVKHSNDSIIRHETMDVTVKTSLLVPHSLVTSGIPCLSLLTYNIPRLTFIFSSGKFRDRFAKSQFLGDSQSLSISTRSEFSRCWRK